MAGSHPLPRAPLLVAALVVLSACAPGTPAEDSWRDDARRAISDVSSAVQTDRVALGADRDGHLYANYLQTVVVDSEDTGGSSADSFASVEPPELERERYDVVSTQLDDAASLLSQVRIAVVAGHTGSYPDLLQKLSEAAAGLDKLDVDLSHPPVGGSRS